MTTGVQELSFVKKSVLAALLSLLMIAACAHRPKPDPTKAEIYFQNWQETEKELSECIQRSGRVNHP